MIRESLYHRTVDILVRAYFNDTLEHANCYACAVGNMIAANCGLKFMTDKSMIKEGVYVFTGVGKLFWSDRNNFEDNPLLAIERGECICTPTEEQFSLAASTGYSFDELAKIEEAFEKVARDVPPKELKSDAVMFAGLMAVIECLDKIHQNNDSQVTQSSKSKFQKV